ncbi:MAG: DUF4440 domain-containing protein [Ruegeria sp.]
MKFSEKWQIAFDQRDRAAFQDLIDDAFVYVRHQSGGEIAKDEMIDIWTSDGPRPVRRDYRVVYENNDILVTHAFMEFPSGNRESVMVVMLLKGGKLVRMETGATPLTS